MSLGEGEKGGGGRRLYFYLSPSRSGRKNIEGEGKRGNEPDLPWVSSDILYGKKKKKGGKKKKKGCRKGNFSPSNIFIREWSVTERKKGALALHIKKERRGERRYSLLHHQRGRGKETRTSLSGGKRKKKKSLSFPMSAIDLMKKGEGREIFTGSRKKKEGG